MPDQRHGLVYIIGAREVIERGPNGLEWVPVVRREDLGVRQVAHIRVHQRCYFAKAAECDYSVATHNPTYKP